jgi:hypothetical protein
MASAATQPEANGHTTADHELADMADKKPSLPLEEDIMQLARLGEIAAIQKLFDSGKYDATYKDEQGITPLHVRADIQSRGEMRESNMGAVGGHQQPLCPLPLPDPGWCAHQRQGW